MGWASYFENIIERNGELKGSNLFFWTHYKTKPKTMLKLRVSMPPDELSTSKTRWLPPGRYVGIKDEVDDGIPFEEKMKKLTAELAGQMEEETKLNKEISKQLSNIGYEL